MRELENGDRNSKSLLANVLDLEGDFILAPGGRPLPQPLSVSRFQFFILNFLLFLQIFLSPDKLTQKKLSNFEKLVFLNDKIDTNTNLAKLPSAKCFFCKVWTF